MENPSLATELLHEVKASATRWFIIAMAELVVIAVLVCVILFTPVEEYTMEQDADRGSYNQIIGGDYNGEAESNL